MENEDIKAPAQREYEQSGLYPKNGKSFRLLALGMFLLGVVGLLALSAYVLNRVLI